jgi:hypothetical protein
MHRLTFLALCLCASFVGSSCGKGTPAAPSPQQNNPPPAAGNHAPAIAVLNVSPLFGIGSLTPINLQGQASDEDKDPLTYSWTVTDAASGVIGSFSGSAVTAAIPTTARSTKAIAHLTVTDGRGGTATADSAEFLVGTMTNTWEVRSSSIPGTVLFYLRLIQDASGKVTGTVADANGAEIGHTDPAGQARIDASGNVTGLRLKFNSGADVTLAGRLVPSAAATSEVDGTFTNTNAVFSGRAINGRPFTLMPN